MLLPSERRLRTTETGEPVRTGIALARAGHSDFKTTQNYIDLAGETFRDEAALLEERLFGAQVSV